MMLPAMGVSALARWLDELDAMKRRVGEEPAARLRELLSKLGRKQFTDAASLVRFHDALLFFWVHPPNARVLRQVDSLLKTTAGRVEYLRQRKADLSLFDNEEAGGVAGTALSSRLGYEEVRWLATRFPGRLSIDWSEFEREGQLGATLPRWIPLLEDEANVEAEVPYLEWLRAASGGERHELTWLLERFEQMPLTIEQKNELFAALDLLIHWELGDSPISRTHARRTVRKVFFQREPLIRRKDVSLAAELATPIRMERLNPREGQKIVDMCREATSVRYRELWGTTRGDARRVVRAEIGRGVEIFLWELSVERRLPLRAYLAGFTLKNGIPINYIEAISLFEWVEVGFNTFYAYRDGETAWIYGKALRLLHQILGATCISVYPYQIGKDNEEAIASGAFWFYRKLGFRCMWPELEKLAQREEARIAANPQRRTAPVTLRRLAQGHVVYEMPQAERGAWDRFRIRNIGFSVGRRMAREFNGDAIQLREGAVKSVARTLQVDPSHWSPEEKKAFGNWALVLSRISDLGRWSDAEKGQIVNAIRAKAGRSEEEYCRFLCGHQRLRRAVLKLGQRNQSTRRTH
jgi:hypothetical protein